MKLTPKLFYSYIVFLVAYAALTLLPAPKAAAIRQYHLTPTGMRLLDITIIILLAIIWYAGFFGYSKLRQYTNLIRKDKDGQQIAKLTTGVFFLVMWLPVSTTVSAFMQLLASKHPSALPTVTIISNYINLLLPLIGFIFIGYGAFGLSSFIRQRPNYKIIQAIALFLIYIGLIYFRLVATTENRSLLYHMSLWLIALTLTAPYIYMWFIGLFAAYEIYRYQSKVAGIVYKKSWVQLAFGIGWLIGTSIVFQYVSTLSGRLQHLSIYWLLVIVYSLLLILSVGFVLIALGARKLQKIEEV